MIGHSSVLLRLNWIKSWSNDWGAWQVGNAFFDQYCGTLYVICEFPSKCEKDTPLLTWTMHCISLNPSWRMAFAPFIHYPSIRHMKWYSYPHPCIDQCPHSSIHKHWGMPIFSRPTNTWEGAAQCMFERLSYPSLTCIIAIAKQVQSLVYTLNVINWQNELKTGVCK